MYVSTLQFFVHILHSVSFLSLTFSYSLTNVFCRHPSPSTQCPYLSYISLLFARICISDPVFVFHKLVFLMLLQMFVAAIPLSALFLFVPCLSQAAFWPSNHFHSFVGVTFHSVSSFCVCMYFKFCICVLGLSHDLRELRLTMLPASPPLFGLRKPSECSFQQFREI